MQTRCMVLAALLAIVSGWPALSQTPPASNHPDFSAFERDVPAQLQKRGIPGLAIVIVKADAVVYERAFGVANVETGEAVGPDTLFRLGSTAKTFAALALSVLAERRQVDFDAPIGRYVEGLHRQVAALTLDQLLTHTSGLADDAAMVGPADDAALAARVRGWSEKALFASPGDVMSYSNPGYALAGHVLERVTGKRFADAVRDLVLLPLGMTRSTYRPLEAFTYPVAQGHEPAAPGPKLLRPIPENAANYPPGSLFSSARELGRFLEAMVNAGTVDGTAVIVPQAIARLTSRAVPMPGSRDLTYGYGVIAGNLRGTQVVENRGARLGYGSMFILVPEQRLGVFCLANRTAAVPDDLVESLLNTLLVPDRARTSPTPAALETIDRARSVGTYVNGDTYPRVTLALEQDSLTATLGSRSAPVLRSSDGWYHAAGVPQLENFRLVRGARTGATFLCTGAVCLRRQDSPSGATRHE